MKKMIFQWKSVLYVGIVLSAIACLFFFSAFFTVDTGYYSISLEGFKWMGVIGSTLCYIWAIPYVVGFITNVFSYFYRRLRYGY